MSASHAVLQQSSGEREGRSVGRSVMWFVGWSVCNSRSNPPKQVNA